MLAACKCARIYSLRDSVRNLQVTPPPEAVPGSDSESARPRAPQSTRLDRFPELGSSAGHTNGTVLRVSQKKISLAVTQTEPGSVKIRVTAAESLRN